MLRPLRTCGFAFDRLTRDKASFGSSPCPHIAIKESVPSKSLESMILLGGPQFHEPQSDRGRTEESPEKLNRLWEKNRPDSPDNFLTHPEVANATCGP